MRTSFLMFARLGLALIVLTTISLLIVPKKHAASPYQALIEQVTVGTAKAGDCPDERCVATGWPQPTCGFAVDEVCGQGGVPPGQLICNRYLCP
jgi:hypothetical protein